MMRNQLTEATATPNKYTTTQLLLDNRRLQNNLQAALNILETR